MTIIFEEGGKLIAARVLSQADHSLQVENASGKRSKIKAQQVLLQYPGDALPQLDSPALLAESAAVDLNLAWEFAPEGEFDAAQLAADYYGTASPAQQLALLLALVGAPHYFRRAGKNRFKKASAEVLQQALAAIDKRQRIAAQIDEWAQALQSGHTPAPIAQQLYAILFKPDKNSAEYKAVAQAARNTQLPVLELLQHAGAVGNTPQAAYHFHWQRFLFTHFPKGTGFASVQAPTIATEQLSLAPVQAFSIDDSATTEIDDALSLSDWERPSVLLGIHIAAPALAITPGDAIDTLARARLSTVYMPGQKITMLPDSVVAQYTLAQGRACPAVSLYLRIDKETLEILDSSTRIEQVPIVANWRLEQLEALVTPEWLAHPPARAAALHGIDDAPAKLAFLHRLAQHWKAQREEVRGKPETFARPDYSFALHNADGDTVRGTVQGDETVHISTRKRGAPVDLIVAESMIAANNIWGQWLASLGVPAIYRSQAALAPGIKVRMGIKALPHAGIGVAAYAWSTSPLRRYVDLVNQWQIIAAARHGATAALAAPFKPKDAQLFAIISAFDAAYSAYGHYQAQMERFWTLRHIQQSGIRQVDASVFKFDGWVRADTLPLTLQALGADSLPRGARARVALGDVDLLSLHIAGSVTERLSDDASAGAEEDAEDAEATEMAGLEIALEPTESTEPAEPSAAQAAGSPA